MLACARVHARKACIVGMPGTTRALHSLALTWLDKSSRRDRQTPVMTLVVYWRARGDSFRALQPPHIEAPQQAHKAAGLEVFAESGEMFPEDVEGFKKYL